jgi:hypothetical protein
MNEFATRLPVRRPGLVCWQTGENGPLLVRDRQTGESFQLGEVEHFLLQQLDGRRTAEDIRRDFAKHFGEPLYGQHLDEFIQLAEGLGLLQRDGQGTGPIRAKHAAGRAGKLDLSPFPGRGEPRSFSCSVVGR